MVKTHIVKYEFDTKQGKIKERIAVYGSTKDEVETVVHNLYPKITVADRWYIDGVFVKTDVFEKESKGKFEYI